mmetsp:Transcript_112857/g.364312  ORF Transcript_112857/g.364312 Transcript_112857/m.364312 type:complete len:346 (-) Transcript_112857:84-1121(-)
MAGAVRSFRAVLGAQRLLFVAGGSTAGRAQVAAAAALALARRAPTLLVDADDPAHGMGDVLGVEELPSSEPMPVSLAGSSGRVDEARNPGGALPSALSAVRLSGPDTRSFLEKLLAAKEWRRLMEQHAGAQVAASIGIPIGELLSVLDCVRPPPGADMPVALARLLTLGGSAQAQHIVVDAGAAALAAQLQSVPPAVAGGLEGFLRLQRLLRDARQAAVPSAVASGLRLLIGKEVRDGASAQFAETLRRVEELHAATAALASADKAVLLVLPQRPGLAGARAACRLVESLQPCCVVLTDHTLGGPPPASRPDWLPPGLAVAHLSWGEERPSGIEDLSILAEALLA